MTSSLFCAKNELQLFIIYGSENRCQIVSGQPGKTPRHTVICKYVH